MRNLLKEVEIRRAMNRQAGTAATWKADLIIDMAGFDEVTFIAAFQTVVNNAVVTMRAAQSATNSTGAMTVSEATLGAITSDGTTIALSNKCLALGITKPAYRYIEIQIVVASQNAPIDGVIAILSKGRSAPVTQGATVISSSIFASPGAA